MVRPVTTQVVVLPSGVAQVCVPGPVADVTVYPVMGLPPVLTGAVQDTTD